MAPDRDDTAARIRAPPPEGVDRIIEVALSDNADLDNAVVAGGAVIAAYATSADRPEALFWPCCSTTSHCGCWAATTSCPTPSGRPRDVTAAAAVGALNVDIAARYTLAEIGQAHDHVDDGSRGRVLLMISD